MDIRARLKTLGLTLPEAAKPLASYVPAVASGDLVFVSGQLPVADGRLQAVGAVPSAVGLEAARSAAARCALNGLAAIDHVIDGDWSRFRQVVRLGVFVLSDAGFTEQSKVADGASEFLAQVFGDQGRHARVAVGAAALPLGATVELEMTIVTTDGGYSY